MLLYLVSWIQAWAFSLRREEGQDLVEYALLLGLIALVAIAAVILLGGRISNVLSTLAGSMTSVAGAT
jgi:pilus assembly protein Flp/PilA